MIGVYRLTIDTHQILIHPSASACQIFSCRHVCVYCKEKAGTQNQGTVPVFCRFCRILFFYRNDAFLQTTHTCYELVESVAACKHVICWCCTLSPLLLCYLLCAKESVLVNVMNILFTCIPATGSYCWPEQSMSHKINLVCIAWMKGKNPDEKKFIAFRVYTCRLYTWLWTQYHQSLLTSIIVCSLICKFFLARTVRLVRCMMSETYAYCCSAECEMLG